MPLLTTNVSQETLIEFLNFVSINVSQKNIKFLVAVTVSQETLILFLNFAF